MENLVDLSGRIVLISGGCGELGLAIVNGLLEQGASVLVNDVRTDEDALALLPESDRIGYVQSASDSEGAAQEVVSASVRRFGALPDTVLCHAGVPGSSPIESFPIGVFDRIMNVNVRSGFLLAQAAAVAWKAERVPGHLVFTSSWVADTPWPGIAPYSASKAAVNALTRGFARELAADGIRANAIAPGIVAAGMAKVQWDTEPDYRARAEKAIPLGRLQDLRSISNAFVFLCSDMAEYMTGSVLVVDGGCSLYPMD